MFVTIQDLKYWRMRMLVVPDLYRHTLRQLMDNWRDFPNAGIYEPLTPDQLNSVNDSFLKFFEMLHRIKRQVVKKPKSSTPQSSTSSLLNTSTTSGGSVVRERSVSARELPGASGGGEGVARERVMSSGGVATKSTCDPPTGSSGVRERLMTSDGTLRSLSPSSIANSTVSSSQDVSLTHLSDARSLCASSELSEIAAAMKAPNTGVSLFSPITHPSLPPLSFLSTYAEAWLRENVRDIATHGEAMALLQRLCTQDYIRHASGRKAATVYYGFYIYFLVTGDREQDRTSNPDTYCQEFHEVEMKAVEDYDLGSSISRDTSQVSQSSPLKSNLPPFLLPEVPASRQPFRTSSGK